MAELTTSPPDTLLEQAGLLSGQGRTALIRPVRSRPPSGPTSG
jgi:hypothetical protein